MLTWRKLESEFKELNKQMLYTRLDAQWGAAGEYWHLAGSFDKNTDKRFTALSSIAGQKLASILNPGVEVENELLREPNPVVRWYKGIWKISQNFEYGFTGEQTHNDGSSAGYIHTGTINKIADAAATFCLELAARYPESQEGEKIPVSPSELSDSNLGRGTKSNKSEDTKVDKYLQKAKNHRYISLLILFGIIVISLATFTDAINKLIDPFPSLHKKSARERAESSQTNTNSVGNAININRSNNVTINQAQNLKIDANNTTSRLKEALRALDAIEAYLYYSIDPEPDKYQTLLSRARIEIKFTRNLKSRVNDLIMNTYDCYHSSGETWRENSPSALLSKGEIIMYDDAIKHFQSTTLPKLSLKWKQCSDHLKKAHEYFEMEGEQ